MWLVIPVFVLFICYIGQLSIIEELFNFYSEVCPTTGAQITYCEHWVLIVQQLRDRQKEGDVLSILSKLYQTLNTDK